MSSSYTLSFAPLRRYAQLAVTPKSDYDDGRSNLADLARAVGVHHDTARGWAYRNTIPLNRADAAACALGVHPAFIWGDEYWELIIRANHGYERMRRKQNARLAARRKRQHINRSSGAIA